MTTLDQIPYLVKLLDDDSFEVQHAVKSELFAFGPILKDEIRKLSLKLNPTQQIELSSIFREQKKNWLRQLWPTWFSLNSDYQKLETSLSYLSEFLSGFNVDIRLKTLLDSLAHQYNQKYSHADPRLLAQFLFKDKGMEGNDKDYYNPQNSNLVFVISNRMGIPISLAAVYMLVGARLKLNIEGCHFPGHFLAKIYLKGNPYFVDCYNGGQIIAKKDIIYTHEDQVEGLEQVLNTSADAETMVRRFLANLIRAYQTREDQESGLLMQKMFKELDDVISDKDIVQLSPDDIIDEQEPLFEEGQLVRHQCYGYRGIVVEVDYQCEATDEWYYANQTQPDRYQPWYHVLVDGTDQVTYVAQSNLVEDQGQLQRIQHPLLDYFFEKDKNGEYLRNENPWPETEF